MRAVCCSPRSRHLPPSGPGARGDWAAWLPLLFIGAMMFWTVALGLGGWSLMVVSDGAMEPVVVPSATAIEPRPGAEAQTGGAPVIERLPERMPDRIPVQMEESQEPEDVNDNAGNVRQAGLPAGSEYSDP
jgi:hypothetical protein